MNNHKMNATTVELPAFRPEDPESPDDFIIEGLRRMNATLATADAAAFTPAPLPAGMVSDDDVTQTMSLPAFVDPVE